MFCMNCGTQLPDNVKFCGMCGAQMPAQPQQGTAPQPMQQAQPQQPMPQQPTQQAMPQPMQQAQPLQPAFQQTAVPNVQPTNDAAEEVILKKGMCNWVKSPLVVQNGKAVLTNKRFMYKKGKIGQLGSSIFNSLAGISSDFEIALSDIVGIREGKQGFAKTLVFVTKSGQEYNCFFYDRENWLMEFNKLLT